MRELTVEQLLYIRGLINSGYDCRDYDPMIESLLDLIAQELRIHSVNAPPPPGRNRY